VSNHGDGDKIFQLGYTEAAGYDDGIEYKTISTTCEIFFVYTGTSSVPRFLFNIHFGKCLKVRVVKRRYQLP